MAEPRLTRFERWLAWLFGTPLGLFVFFLVCAGLLALCIWTDGLARESGRESVLAPTRADLWSGIRFGAGLGLVTVVAGSLHRLLYLLLSPRRSAKNWEPTGWRRWVLYASLGANLLLTFAVVMVLGWWAMRSRTPLFRLFPPFLFSLLPPYFAVLVVQIVTSLLRGALLGSASQDEDAEPVPTEN